MWCVVVFVRDGWVRCGARKTVYVKRFLLLSLFGSQVSWLWLELFVVG